ncbi:MAG: hypothetical protein JWQ96_2660 [Segetibacter sp.]|nr:hypothetical protein [Segetibacter sp.]
MENDKSNSTGNSEGQTTHQEQFPSQQKERRKLGNDENVEAAHTEAEKDIEEDAELTFPGEGDDLDEGESARAHNGSDNESLI